MKLVEINILEPQLSSAYLIYSMYVTLVLHVIFRSVGLSPANKLVFHLASVCRPLALIRTKMAIHLKLAHQPVDPGCAAVG